jgi:hypothetical protein
MDTLCPLFVAAAEGVWPLVVRQEIDSSIMRQVFADALSRQLEVTEDGQARMVTTTEVATVSVLSFSEYRASHNRIQGKLDLVSWGTSVSAQAYMAYGAEVDGTLYGAIDDVMTDTLFNQLGLVRIGDEIIQERWPLVWDAVKVMLFYYAGLVRCNRLEPLRRLEPAIRALPKVLPAGFRRDMRGTLALLGA